MEAQMKTKVAKIVNDYSNGGHPIAHAICSCGHYTKVRMRRQLLACVKCGLQREDGPKCLSCDCGMADMVGKYPHMHCEADRLTKVGDEVECERCDWYANALVKIKDLAANGAISHSRFRPNDSRGSKDGNFYVYGRDPKSPSGFCMIASIEATDESSRLLSRVGAAPLSPTER